MNYNEILAAAKDQVGPYCKACPVCNGRACANAMPGPGCKYPGNAAARNFENSLQLNQITKKYQQLWLAAKMSGADTTVADENFSSEVASVFSRVWAVTVQLRRYQLDQAKAERNELAHAQDKTEAEVQEAKERLNSAITLLKAEIKTLQYKPGVQIQSAAQEYTSRVQRRLQENTFSVQQAQAAQDEQAAQQSTNLQIKSNHKKPVAK